MVKMTKFIKHSTVNLFNDYALPTFKHRLIFLTRCLPWLCWARHSVWAPRGRRPPWYGWRWPCDRRATHSSAESSPSQRSQRTRRTCKRKTPMRMTSRRVLSAVMITLLYCGDFTRLFSAEMAQTVQQPNVYHVQRLILNFGVKIVIASSIQVCCIKRINLIVWRQ